MADGIKRQLTRVDAQRWARLIGILWLAFALRFLLLGAQELRGDEAASWARITQEPGPIELFQRLVSEGQPHPPLHYWLLQAWGQVFGYSEFALRSLSALLSLLVVALTYRVARQLRLGLNVALLAALFTAVHPYQIWLAQDAKNMYQLSLIGVLVATLALPALLAGKWRAWVIYVISAALAMLSHYYAIFGLLAHGSYVLLSTSSWQARGRWVLAGCGVVGLMLPWALVALPGMTSHQFSLARSSDLTLGAFLSQTLGDAAIGPAMPDAPALLGALLMSALIVVGAASLWRKQRAAGGSLLSWVLIAATGSWIVMQVRPTYNTFYMSNAYPAIYLLMAVAFERLWVRRALAVALGAVIALALLIGLSNYYVDPRWSKSRGLRELAAVLAVNAQPNDVLITNYPDPATVYYLRGLPLLNVLLPPQPQFDPAEMNAALDRLAAEHDRLWLIPVRYAAWDAEGFVEAQLTARYVSATDQRFKQLRLRSFTDRPEQLPAYQAQAAQFEPGVQLLGSYVTIDGDPAREQIDPGQWLRVALRWSSAAPLSADYKVFVHAVDANGSIVAQHDAMPHAGMAPTSGWQVGATVLDVHEFQVPAESAGVPVEIRVGVYDPATGQRLDLAQGGDSVSVWRRGQ